MPIYLRRSSQAPFEAATEPSPEEIKNATWIDLLSPNSEEVKTVEAALGIEIPTPDEMKEIESTSRLYCENGIRVMNTPLLVDTSKASPTRTEVSFILAPQRLITLRDRDSASFRITAQQFSRGSISNKRDAILLSLLENIVDRQADMLERLSLEVDQISEKIFTRYAQSRDTEKNLREAIYALGRNGDLLPASATASPPSPASSSTPGTKTSTTPPNEPKSPCPSSPVSSPWPATSSPSPSSPAFSPPKSTSCSTPPSDS